MNKKIGGKVNPNMFANHEIFKKTLADLNKKNDNALQKLEEDLITFQVTKINPGYLGNLVISGGSGKICDLASVSLENRTFSLTVHDKGKISVITKTIEQERSLTVSQGNEKTLLKITIPDPTEERRRKVIEEMRKYCGRFIDQINNGRAEALKFCDQLEKAQKDSKKSKDKKKGGDESSGPGVSEDEIKMFRVLVDQMKEEKIQRINSLIDKQESDIINGRK